MQHAEPSASSGGGGVVCEFVRQRCTHDALFQPFYKRSNRTKGSKILRCFPHCCPNHAHRGFCGSSLHVRVEWPSAAPGLRSPPPPPSIHVLGRFRLSDTPPLPLGHALQAATVFGAVQSDDTPNGEWIDSQMIYSWSETNWLFEINSTARWFYGWESSTVKSQRLKDHVLDVYVFASSSSSSAAADVLRVVAATTSPSFQLISFRRATDDAMLALSATHHVRQQLQSGAATGGPPHLPPPPPAATDPLQHAHRLLQLHHHPHHPQQLHHHEEDAASSRGPRQPLVRYHAEMPPSSSMVTSPPMNMAPPPPPHATMRPLHHLHQAPTHASTPVTRPLSLPSLRPPLLSAAPPTTSVAQWTAPPLTSSVATSRPLTSLAPLHRPPPPSMRAFPPTSQSSQVPTTRPLMLRPAAFALPTHDARPQPAWRPPQLTIARQAAPLISASSATSSSTVTPASSSTGAGGRDSAAWEISNLLALLRQVPLADAFERVAWVHETYARSAAEYAADVAASDPTIKTEQPPALRVDADAEMSVRRALASLGLHTTSARKLPSRLLTTLTELAVWLFFDPVTIRQLQGAARSATTTLADPPLVRRYYSRAVFFLHDHIGRFLERRFQTTIRDVLRECETVGMQLEHETDAPAAVASSPNAAAGGDRAMKGQDAFVAQAREELVEATKTEARAKRRRLGGPIRPLVAASLRTQLSQQWACSLNDVLVHRALVSSAAAPPTDVSVLTLLWFYRQFSVVSLTLDADARLDVRSLFALSSPLCSQLVLDGADRFLRAFPAGEATLATGVGRYTFGDYVGELCGETQLRVQLFAFLSPTQLPGGEAPLPLERVAADACVCYDVRLRAADNATLVGDVAVRVGVLDAPLLRRAGHGDARALLREIATWTLREKLAAVRHFDETARVELVYHATERDGMSA